MAVDDTTDTTSNGDMQLRARSVKTTILVPPALDESRMKAFKLFRHHQQKTHHDYDNTNDDNSKNTTVQSEEDDYSYTDIYNKFSDRYTNITI